MQEVHVQCRDSKDVWYNIIIEILKSDIIVNKVFIFMHEIEQIRKV